MTTMTLEQVIEAAKEAGACAEALRWARQQPDIETAATGLQPAWAYWLRRNVPNLSLEVRTAARCSWCKAPQPREVKRA